MANSDLPSFYSLLGVTQAASEAEILRAWRKRMTNYHPDKAGSEAEDMAKLLNQAKSVLCDKTERMKYDERRDEATEDYESGADLPRLPTGKTLSKDLMSRIAAWRESSETAHGAQCDPNGFANKFFEETRQAVLDLQEKLRVIKRTRRSTLQSPVFIESIASDELSEEHLDDEVLTEACKWARETLEKTLKRNTQTKVPPVQEGELVCCYDLSSLKESELRKLMVILIPPSGSKPLSSDPEKMRQRLKDVLPKFRVDVNRERRGIKKFFLGARCVVCSAEKDLSERKCFLVAGACHEFRPVCLTCSKLESKKRLQLWEELAATPQTGFVASYVATGIASIERMMYNLKINQPKSVVEATFDSSIALTTKLFLAASALWLALQKSQRNERDIESLQRRQTELVLEISEEKDPDQELRLLLLLVENGESALESNENFRSFLTQEEARLKLIVDSADLNNSIHIAFSQSPRDRLLLRQASKSAKLADEALAKAKLESRIVGLFLRGAGILSCSGDVTAQLRGMKDLTKAVLEGYSVFYHSDLISSVMRIVSRFGALCGTFPVHALFHLIDNPWSDCQGMFSRQTASSETPAKAQVPLFPGIYVPGHSVQALKKSEIAISRRLEKSQMTPLQAAMSALDLAMACETLAEVLACFLECVALLLRALEIEESLYQRFALKEAMFEIGIASVSICLNNFSDSALLNYVSRHAFALLRDAATKVGRPDDVERLISILEIVAFTGRFSPFVSLPLVRPSESLVFSNVLKKCAGQLLCGLSQPENSYFLELPKSIIAYQSLEYSISSSAFTESETRQLELLTAREMLREQNLDFNNVAALINPCYLDVPEDGWLVPNQTLDFSGCGNTYLSIDKVIFNKNTFQISVVGSKGNLVSDFDVLTGLLMDHPGVAFSLDKPANLHEARFHPFQKYWSSQPDLLKGTPLLDTLFNTDYIMKQFSSGLEICRKPPFDRRPLLNGRGLFAGLPDQLRWLLRPLSERGGQRSRCSRFWIAATDMEMKVEETPDTIEFVFGKVRLEVKTHRMVASMGGEHQDAETDDEDSPENQFAKDMTEALPSLGRFFPEFERLKELTKIPKLCLIIKAMHQSLGAMTVRQEQVEQILDHERAVRMEKSYEMAKNVLETLDRAESIPGASHYDCCNLAADQLLSQLNLNKTETVRALRRRDVRTLQYLLADSLPSRSAADVRQQIQDLIDSKRREFRDWNSKILHKLNSSLHQRQQKISDCDWAPAVLSASSDATTRSTVYGGVLLNPKSVHSSFRMEFPPGSTVHKVVSFLILGELNSKQFASTRTFDSLDLWTVNELLGNKFPEMESSSDSELGGRSGRDNEGATSSADNQPRTSKNDQFLNDEGNWSHIFSDKPGHVVPRNAKEEWELRKKLVSIRDLALKKDPRCIDASQQFVHVEGRKNNCRFIFYKDERETSSDVLHLAWWIRIDGNGRIVGAGCNTVLAKERIPQLFLFLRPIPTGEALMAFFLREKHKLHGKKTDVEFHDHLSTIRKEFNIVSERAKSERQYTVGARLSAAAIAAAVEEGPEGYVFVE
ncbi:hypothetical protein BOX15_Mlig017921g3 [Macrostomum lignano]|uniref:J domain-containing protein n=1 Tax=Macrostomum lignano TaxID=282301 RepID=A0A267G5G5_9PLAT|nr:hypothetical protein BOX15_Mlig017921g3 [Macrostomum lignano]